MVGMGELVLRDLRDTEVGCRGWVHSRLCGTR